MIGKGILRITPTDFLRQLTTMRVSDAKVCASNSRPRRVSAVSSPATAGRLRGHLLSRDLRRRCEHAAQERQLRVGAPEIYPVITDDGVTLRLTRYRGGEKGPLLVAHGLGVSSSIFTIDTIETNLLEYVFARGYDVWLLDYRASIELRSSRSQFSGDDVATRDFPAAVQRGTGEDRRRSVQVIAHCFGATTFTCALLAGLQECARP